MSLLLKDLDKDSNIKYFIWCVIAAFKLIKADTKQNKYESMCLF